MFTEQQDSRGQLLKEVETIKEDRTSAEQTDISVIEDASLAQTIIETSLRLISVDQNLNVIKVVSHLCVLHRGVSDLQFRRFLGSDFQKKTRRNSDKWH